MSTTYSTEVFTGTLCQSLEFSLCVPLSYLVLFHVKSSLSDYQLCLLNWRRSPDSNMVFFLFTQQSRNYLQVIIWGNHRVYVVCFLSLADHCPLLPGAQCVKAIAFILFKKLFQVGRLNPVPFTSSWLEAEVSCAFWVLYQLFGKSGQLCCLFPLST